MTIHYYGPFIAIQYRADEVSEANQIIQLPDGYSYERILVHFVSNVNELHMYQNVKSGDRITFPVVNGKSPSILYVNILDIHKPAFLRFSIEKFGQIPDPHYFDRAFDPILVPGDDGNEYPVIPSDQFK